MVEYCRATSDMNTILSIYPSPTHCLVAGSEVALSLLGGGFFFNHYRNG